MAHISTIIPALDGLLKRLDELKDEIIKRTGINGGAPLKKGDVITDIRLLSIEKIQLVFASAKMWVSTFTSLTEIIKQNSLDVNKDFVRLVNGHPDEVLTEQTMFDSVRQNMIIMPHFYIDALFFSLLDELNLAPKRSFEKNLTKVVDLVDKNSKKKTHEALKVLSLIRNGYHNFFINKNSSGKYKILNDTFSFENGKHIEGISIDRILPLMFVVVEALEEILLSPKVVSIKKNITK